MAWEIYYPDNTKESFPLERAPQATATPHAPLRRISVPDAPCQPRDKVTSPHPTETSIIKLKLKFHEMLNLIFVLTRGTPPHVLPK